jgi:hypothetical protein
MSIVGATGVSLKDLTALGIPALTAMAQGQVQSVAPSYMVLAALKSLVDTKAGAGTPMPQGTVKDQLVAAAQPPQQAGIGAMMPMQKFSDGGKVYSRDGRYRYEPTFFDKPTGYEGMSFSEVARSVGDSVSKFGGSIADWLENLDSRMKRVVRGEEQPVTAPTTPTRVAYNDRRDDPNPYTAPQAAVETAAKLPVTKEEPLKDVSGKSRTSAGIASVGRNPASRYAIKTAPGFKEPAGRETHKLDIPVNEYLQQAFDRRSGADPRITELKQAEQNAGLAAFAENIMKGRGFGGAFPGAAAATQRAMQEKADKRMEYELARERARDQLGISIGDQKRGDYLAGVKYGDERYDSAFNQAAKQQELGIAGATAENTANYQRANIDAEYAKISATLAAVREQAAARKDSNMLSRLSTLENQRAQRMEAARKNIMDEYTKNPLFATDQRMQWDARRRSEDAATAVDKQFMLMIRPVLRDMGVNVE